MRQSLVEDILCPSTYPACCLPARLGLSTEAFLLRTLSSLPSDACHLLPPLPPLPLLLLLPHLCPPSRAPRQLLPRVGAVVLQVVEAGLVGDQLQPLMQQLTNGDGALNACAH